ncbi:MAG TPA: CoB--CoM heterodisulfide reductase iron-sulfur subunit A family protein [Candidatus Lokiarchaeia archaeon]|nr:CoB--CoM heterodisulfide reductase iron-sulfur subunit A family protein [Candidatus Lokiarchaeia archaeon]
MTENNDIQVDPPRIGVFVCHCGSNIGGLLDCKKLAEYAETLPDVVYGEDNLYTCSETGLSSIKKAIKEHELNRVVVCSCTPRTHEPLFRKTVQEAGLNPYLFNFVNIRDQCSWVHMKEPEAAFDKAKDLIRMGAAKATKLEPLNKNIVNINPVAMIIGGGVSGMSAALSLSKQGFKTYLIEKEPMLGGLVNDLYTLAPANVKSSEFLEKMKGEIASSSNLEVFTSTVVKSIQGFVGQFSVDLDNDGTLVKVDTGIIIVAIGAKSLKPFGLYGYDGSNVVTQLELESMLQDESYSPKNVVMIQCVGARNAERNYCSSVCCMTAIKNALILKERDPSAKVTVLFRDIYMPGIFQEKMYKKARDNGIIFLKYSPEKQPVVEQDVVKVHNEFINDVVAIPRDMVVLSTPLVAYDDNKELGQLLKVPLQENGFFLEAHVKLRPVDFATDGIFIGGAAKWPADITESISQGLAAASRASTILSSEMLEVEGATACLPEVNKNLCKGCEVCLNVCPFKAIVKNQNGDIEVIQALCKGCGTCVATCTRKALTIRHFTNEQILSEIIALTSE